MSSGAIDEEQRIRQLVTRLEEAYYAGKISKEVYERLSKKFREQLGVSGEAAMGLLPEGVSSPIGPSVPRIVAIERVGYRPAPRKSSAQFAVAIVAFLMIIVMILIAISVRR